MIIGYRIKVWGRVQGVGFRYQTQQLAKRLGINGNVTNQIDGSVLVNAEGETVALLEFVEAVKKSPTPFGDVIKIQIDKVDVIGYTNFETH